MVVVVLEAFLVVGGLVVGMPGDAFALASCQVGADLVVAWWEEVALRQPSSLWDQSLPFE